MAVTSLWLMRPILMRHAISLCRSSIFFSPQRQKGAVNLELATARDAA